MIYFIREGKHGNIKIGYTSDDIAKRLSELQTGNSNNLEAILLLEGDLNREKELHDKFEHLRVRPNGEWFYPEDDLIGYINDPKNSETVNEKILNLSNQNSRLITENARLKKEIEISKQYEIFPIKHETEQLDSRTSSGIPADAQAIIRMRSKTPPISWNEIVRRITGSASTGGRQQKKIKAYVRLYKPEIE